MLIRLCASDATNHSPHDQAPAVSHNAFAARNVGLHHNDKKPGDITGDGFANGVWHIAQP